MKDYQHLRDIHPEYFDFLMQWQLVVQILIFAALALAVIFYIGYQLAYASKKTYKEKFDLASAFETKRYFQVHVLLGIALFFFINTLRPDVVAMNPVWLGIRFFIAACGGVLYIYIASLLLKYYWPGPLNKKLRKLRYTPRINPKTGNKMKLLSEAEEDAYLDEGMQAEENVFSVDYDVWIDEATEDTLIEKYAGHLVAFECDRCGFQTLKLDKEEVIKEATAQEDGLLKKEFKCTYCGRIKRKEVILSRKIRQDVSTGKLVDDPLNTRKHVVTVKIDLYSNENDHVSFEFQNKNEAKKFLEEFEFDKTQ
jgi:transcription elongation factor Elf1